MASLSIKLRDERRLDGVRMQVLVNPALDLTPEGTSYKAYPFFVEWYLNDVKTESRECLASPLLGTDLRGLPRTFIVTCEMDEIRGDGDEYRRKLQDAGVEVELVNIPDMGHLGVLWAGAHPSAVPAMEQVANRLSVLMKKGYATNH